MTKNAARWRRYYMGHLEHEQSRARAYYYANRDTILAKRKKERDRKKREEAKAC